MRILVVSHNYPRFAGDPAGAYVRRLALGFAQRGHATMVLAPHAAGAPEVEQERELTVRRFRYAPAAWERVGYRGEARLGRLALGVTLPLLPAYLSRFRGACRRLAREFAADLIHAHWWFPGGWVSRSLGPGLVITSHGSDVRLLERAALARRMARGVARAAGRWTAVSRFLARDIEQRVKLADGTVAVTPMPVDLDLFAAGRNVAKADPPRILYAGNLLPSKGIDVLVEATGLLLARGVRCTLRILGEGPARDAIARLVAERGLSDTVSLSRFVPQSAMPAEYGAAAVTVLPTRGRAEGLGLTLVEALLAGSAVVGTPAGGIPEVVEDGVTGLLARDGDAAHLASQLERLLTDPLLRDRLTRAGEARVRAGFGLEPAVSRFLDLFHELTGRHAGR
jgi:glycosyltransferase involved in cell wall biosynthesis